MYMFYYVNICGLCTCTCILSSCVQVNGKLKPEVIALVTAAVLYARVFNAIFPSESLPVGDETFWPLIHGLARHGVYAVEAGGQTVNHAALSQTVPFREVHKYMYSRKLFAPFVFSKKSSKMATNESNKMV